MSPNSVEAQVAALKAAVETLINILAAPGSPMAARVRTTVGEGGRITTPRLLPALEAVMDVMDR